MIKATHLTKQYGANMALYDANFEIQKGEVVGFLGPNGAGKSTTMNIMTGCLSPTDGTVKIGGFDILEVAAKVMDEEYPNVRFRPEAPDEMTRRVGQSAAAASLPKRL